MDRYQDNVIWQGKTWHLRLTSLTLPDGSLHESAYIDHPGSVVIVPLLGSETAPEVLTLRQHRHSIHKTIIELPAGTRGWNEDLLLCAQRELREETGHSAELFVDLGKYWPAPGVTNEVMSLFLATGLKYDPLPLDADEEIELQAFAFDDLLALALDGRLQDAKSVVGIIRSAVYLQVAPFDNGA
ncbi:MAG: NUDIX hydrolase [Candidatus Promineifilaceae bacterium]|jgi:ADP-ribose pyrophosphatase